MSENDVIAEIASAIESRDSKLIAGSIKALGALVGESMAAYEALSMGASGLVGPSDAEGITRFFDCHAESEEGESMGGLLAVARSHEQAASWMRGQFECFVGDVYVVDLLTGRTRKFDFCEEET